MRVLLHLPVLCLMLLAGGAWVGRLRRLPNRFGRCWRGRSCLVGRAYVAGVFDNAHSLTERWLFVKHFCEPDGVGNSELVAVVKKYMGEHPEQMKFTAAGIVYDALTGVYPCD